MNAATALPTLPATISTPKVTRGYDEGTLLTNVTLTINGEEKTASFWDDDEFGIISTAEDNYGTEDTTIWENLTPVENAAIHAWGRAVHFRLLQLAPADEDSMPSEDSAEYAETLAAITR